MKTFLTIAAVVAGLALVIWLITKGPALFKTPSGATTDTPATLNPTVSTTSYGK